MEVGYIGSAGVHLYRTTYYNEQQPGSPTSNVNLRRPFPFFGFMQLVEGASHSSYDSLTTRVEQRFTKGFTLLSSFNYQKSIDNGSGVRQANGDSYTPQNVYNLAGERGLSAFDYRYRWVNSLLYELPVGRGKALLANANAIVQGVLGGWQLGGILTWQAGFPFSAFCASGSTYQNTDTPCRADATGVSPSLANPTPNAWFNTAAFVNRLNFVPGVGPYTFGNSGRNVMIGPGIVEVDTSLQKSFYLTERAHLDFRSEFFNIPNHPILGQPGSTIGTPTYGVISSTALPSRQIQFALKLMF
jgi:hypothetical protein